MCIHGIYVIGHTRTGRHLRMIGAGRCKALIQATFIEIMPLIGQAHPKITPDHHQPLMRPISFIGRKQVDIGA